MTTYVKLFGYILDSSVWQQPAPTRLLWITMLAMADRDGVVEASIPGLAKRAGIERADCELALEQLMAPDPDSKNPSNEGRRIAKVQGGWILLNYELYRDIGSAEEKRLRDAERQQRKRLRDVNRSHGESVTDRDSHASSQAVTENPSSHAESQKVASYTQIRIRSDQLPPPTPPSGGGAREDSDLPEPEPAQPPPSSLLPPEPPSQVKPKPVPLAAEDPAVVRARVTYAGRPNYEPEPLPKQPEQAPHEPRQAPSNESAYDLARRIFAELWAARYGQSYNFSPNLGPKGEEVALRKIGDLAKAWNGADAERYCRYAIGAYLRDSDPKLVEERHPVGWLIHRLNKYGEPKKPNPARARQSKPDDTPPVPLERMIELANMTAKIGAGG